MSMYFGLDFGNSSLKAVSVTGVNTNSFVLSGVGLVPFQPKLRGNVFCLIQRDYQM